MSSTGFPRLRRSTPASWPAVSCLAGRHPAVLPLVARQAPHGLPEQGADTLVWLANSTPPRDWASGLYYIKRTPSVPIKAARDDGLADALWSASADPVGL